MNFDALARLAAESGFTAWAPLDTSTVELRDEVRGLCAENACGQYGRRWSCPPACGTLAECDARLRRYPGGILVQTCGPVEGRRDFAAIARIEADHKAHFARMYATLQSWGVDALALGAGFCNLCSRCTCPDRPCRFPDAMVSSMEAYGMLVAEVCGRNGMQYDYGPDRLAFTSCFLVR